VTTKSKSERAARSVAPVKSVAARKNAPRRAAEKKTPAASASAKSSRAPTKKGADRAPSATQALAGALLPAVSMPMPDMSELRETVSKISISMPDSLARAVRELVGPGRLSAYVSAAVQRQIELDRLAEYVAAVEQDLGRPISEELMAEAEAAWHAE
jgi:Arc/MetJ-type ribon-helix-helix transcriptional regulator